MYSGFQGYQRTDNNVFLNLRNLKITGIYVYNYRHPKRSTGGCRKPGRVQYYHGRFQNPEKRRRRKTYPHRWQRADPFPG